MDDKSSSGLLPSCRWLELLRFSKAHLTLDSCSPRAAGKHCQLLVKKLFPGLWAMCTVNQHAMQIRWQLISGSKTVSIETAALAAYVVW